MKKKITSIFIFFILSMISINVSAQNNGMIWISNHQLTLAVHDTAEIWAAVSPTSFSGELITVTVSNPGIASVNRSHFSGNADSLQRFSVTGLSLGTTYAVFMSHDGFSDTCQIVVSNAVPVTGIQVSPNFLTISNTPNTGYPVSVNVLPHNASNSSVTITNLNPGIASIDPATRMVTPLSVGSTCLLFRTVEGGYTDSCIVIVTADTTSGGDTTHPGGIVVTGIQVSPHVLTIPNTPNIGYPVSVNVLPYNATIRAVTVTNLNPGIATVDTSNWMVTPLSVGSTSLLFRTVDGGYTDSCIVIVTADTTSGGDTTHPGGIAVTGIQVSPHVLTIPNMPNIGYPVSVNVLPYNATNRAVTVTNLNPGIATIDTSTWMVTPLSVGSTSLLFRTVDGGYTDSCFVIVTADTINGGDTISPGGIPVTGIQVSPRLLTISGTSSQIYTVSVSVLPHNASNQAVTITNLDPMVATINPITRVVTPLSIGSTCLLFRTVDGGYTDSCWVNVIEMDTIPSDTIPNFQTAEISGFVSRQDSSMVTAGLVYLYPYPAPYCVDTAMIKPDGSYQFSNVGMGNYILKAVSFGMQNLVPTYYGNTATWEDATVIQVFDSLPILNRNIVMIELDSLNGKGVISGYVEEEGGSKSLSKSSVTAPAVGVNVYLQHKELQNGTYVFVTGAQSQTDEKGYYEFRNIPVGEYKIILDITGIGMLGVYTVEIKGDETIQDRDYQITVNGIIPTKPLGISDPGQKATQYQVYPNPTTGILVLKNLTGNEKYVDVYSPEGRLVQRSAISDTNATVDIQNLNRGIYILRIGGKSIKVVKH